jgi:nitroimidazol reductase NimA-like FMN-containing flavoprotein (pyridoxamine 5'-phosphate oxidase superfamily)
MQKVIAQVRDLKIIEGELGSNIAGVLAITLENDSLAQIATPFLYHDKNIYIFFSNENEIFEKIQSGHFASFTIIKIGKVRKSKSMDFEPTYRFLSISVKGAVRNVEDNKLIEDLRGLYMDKYKKSKDGIINFTALSKVIIIDTEEIQAFQEVGG